MTEQDKKLIIRLWEGGEPMSSIVQLLPYKPYHARLMIEELKKNGTLQGRSGKSEKKTWDKVLQAYNDGKTNPYDIAKMFGLKVSTVNTILSNSRLNRKKPEHNYNQFPLTEKTKQIILEIQSGKSLSEIARHYNVSRQNIHKIKNKYSNYNKTDDSSLNLYKNNSEVTIMPIINHVNITLGDIKRNLSNGSYVIPDFQRDFVWTLEQSAKLIDSWVKGFPIGIFIMWVTDTELCPTKKIGNIIAFEHQDISEKFTYILDGQQRITSLYATIKGLKIDKKRDYQNIVINLDSIQPDGTPIDYSEDVVTVLRADSNFAYIKASELFDIKVASMAKKYDEKTLDKIQAFRDLILQKSFDSIKIENANIVIATDIFTRLNTGAKKLSPFEIMTAKTYVEGEFNLVPMTRNLIDSLDVDYRENFKESDVLKILALCIKKNTTPKMQLSLTKEEVATNFNDITAAIKRAISFCKLHLNIKTGKYLPYSGIIWLYTYFYYKFGKQNNALRNPTPWQIMYLKDYYWRVVLNERYDRATDPRIAHDAIHVIDNILNLDTPRQESVNISVEGFIEDGKFDKKSAYIMGLINLLISKDPKSLKTNSSIDFNNIWASQADKNNFHHFFPKKMENQIWNKNDPVDNICNIILSDAATNQIDIGNQRPSAYIPNLTKDNPDIGETLKNHLIDNIDDFGILQDDFILFTKKRAQSFIKELKSRLQVSDDDKINDSID